MVARLPERPARLLPIPELIVRAAGMAETVRETLSGKSRAFNADKARELLAGEWLCESNLRRELDLPAPIPLEEGLRATWNWYLRQGWLNL
jgi:nucleoside-diphosphate-sugar epimerase